MKEIKFFPLRPKKKYNNFIIKIFLFLVIIHCCLFEKCKNRDNPFLLKGECVPTCKEEDIKTNLCKLDNEIIKLQYLNNIIYFKEDKIEYLNFEESEKNNLYFFLSEYPKTNVRIIYMLNNEGYGLLNRDNPIYSNIINDTDKEGRFESDIFTFHLLSDTDETEYLISITKSMQNIEIYDFKSNKVYFNMKTMDFFSLINIYTIVGTHIKLKKQKNNYIIGLLACEYNSNNLFGIGAKHFYLKKGNFTSLDISKSQPFDSKKAPSSPAKMISCYETLSNDIVCFYQNLEYEYIMIVYDYDLNEKTNDTIAQGSNKAGNENLFFKCIHFYDDTGVFGYFNYLKDDNDDENPIIIFQFKKYVTNDNLIIDGYESFSQLSINDIFFNHSIVTTSDMIKIRDKNFYYVGISLTGDILYIISICNYYQDKFSTRIYSINIQNIYNQSCLNVIKIGLYKGFLTFGTKNNHTKYISLIIFSYPNTSETNLDIMDYLYKNDEIKIDNLMLNLKGEFIMENNLFGYIYSGIQIIENCNLLEEIYLVDSKNKRITNYFLSKNEKIKLFIKKNKIYSPFVCKFKYASVVSEPGYLEYNKYPIRINYIGENIEEKHFETHNYIGKYNYYNIELTSELKEENCEDNCALCNANNKCITCKIESNFEKDIKICKNDNNDKIDETTDISKDSSNDSIDSTNINSNKEYIEECKPIDFLNYLCKTNNNVDKDNMVKNIRMDIENHSLDTLISDIIIKEKKDYIVKDNDTIYQITSTEIQNNYNYNNISKIILGECEYILKRKYNISENGSLIIFKVEYNKSDSLIPIIGYEVFHPDNKSQLDLTYCKDEMVNFSIPVIIDEDNLYKYDPNDEYYTDQCKPYTTESGTDILLSDRRSEYNDNNLSLCENNCNLDSYDSNTKQVICNCKIKSKQILISDIANQSDILNYDFIDDESSNTMKCYYTLFTKDGIFLNIASYILIITIIAFLISIFIFYKCGYYILQEDIKEILLIRKDLIKKSKKTNNPIQKNKKK